jgi:hypothetical protein
MPRSANSTSAADKSASRVPVDRSERAVRAAVIAPVNTARRFKSNHLFNEWCGVLVPVGTRLQWTPETAAFGIRSSRDHFIVPTRGLDRQRIE